MKEWHSKVILLHYLHTQDGGEGSGNFGHKGRPGEVGGSGKGNGAVSGGGIHASGYTYNRLKGSNTDHYVSKGKRTRALPKGSGSTVISARDVDHGIHSVNKYLTPEGGLVPEREKLHQDAVNELFEGKKPAPEGQRQFFILGGGPASGKGSLTNPATCKNYGVPSYEEQATIDADEMKKRLPEYKQMTGEKSTAKQKENAASFNHEESSAMAKRAMSSAFANGYNCTLDGTGDGSVGSVVKKINQAREAGYSVNAAYVTCPTDVAVARAAARAKKTNRNVPEHVIRNTHAKVSQIFPKVAPLFDHVTLYDTDVPLGEKPILIAECNYGEPIRVIDPKRYEAFLAKGNV